MSYNSNLGYAELNPYVVSGQFTNPTNSQYAGSFGSNETQGGPICNSGLIRGGGTKGKGTKKWQDSIRRKIKNITRKYKKMAKQRSKSMRKRLRSRYLRKSQTKSRGRGRSRGLSGGWLRKPSRRKSSKKRGGGQSGGYAQYGSNTLPYPASYSVGGDLPPSLSALASPPPVGGNAPYVDNYNRFTNSGFSSV
jgi:hypothetical protein